MSHFVLLVIGAKNSSEVSQKLDPFWELDMTVEDRKLDPRSSFEIKFTVEEAKEEYKKFHERCPTQKQIDYAHEQLLKKGPQDISSIEPINKKKFEKWARKNNLDKYYVENKIMKGYYKDYHDWMNKWYCYHHEEGKGYGYWGNLNAKWDWYQIGGRWSGYFRLKEKAKEKGINGTPSLLMGEKTKALVKDPLLCDIARKGDIDFEGMMLENKANAEKHWDKYQKELEENVDKEKVKQDAFLKYGIEEKDTKVRYLLRNSLVSPFAVIKNGQWYQRGEMGWWGCVSDEKDAHNWDQEYKKLLEDIDDNTYLAIVDCHI